jgi:hypothetical protein
MTDQFLPYDLSLELKLIGYDEPCMAYYDIEDSNKLKPIPMNDEINSFNSNQNSLMVSAPLYQQVYDYLLNKHNLHIMFINDFNNKFNFEIYRTNILRLPYDNKVSTTLEKAKYFSIKKSLELIRESMIK